MRRFLFRHLRRLKERCEGLAAMEFAFVAPVLLLLTLGTMEVGMITFASTLLSSGLREASRFGMTGEEPTSGTRKDEIVNIINANGAGVINITAANIETLIYPNFAQIGEPEPFTDESTPPNGKYDAGEPYTDINCNNQWDPDMGRAGLGAGGEIVLYTVNYDLEMITGILDSMIGEDGKFPLSASVAVRNEPFPGGGAGCS